MELLKSALVLLISLSVGFAQQPVLGGCSKLCQNRDIYLTNDKLIGIWYLHSSIPRFFEEDMKCTFINNTVLGEDHLYFIKQELNIVTNEPRETFGAIEFTNEGVTSIFYTDLLLPFEYQTVALTEDYWILLACNTCGFFSKEGAGYYAYIFTRLQYPPCELNSEILDILNICGVQKQYIVEQDQNNCSFC